MGQAAAVDLLLRAYREEIAWLLARANESNGISGLVAADYVHRARNLEAIIAGYERLNAQATNEPKAQGSIRAPL